jgi:membrane associated rhomboid family serine protease
VSQRQQNRDPLLPRGALVFISIVVTLGWLGTVVAVVLDSANSGPLLISSGVLTTVIGAAFGVQIRRSNNDSGDRP